MGNGMDSIDIEALFSLSDDMDKAGEADVSRAARGQLGPGEASYRPFSDGRGDFENFGILARLGRGCGERRGWARTARLRQYQ